MKKGYIFTYCKEKNKIEIFRLFENGDKEFYTEKSLQQPKCDTDKVDAMIEIFETLIFDCNQLREFFKI